MASVQNRKDSYRVIYRYDGEQYFLPLGKVSETEAKARCEQVEEWLDPLQRGKSKLPAGVDIEEFIRHDGEPPVATVGDVAKPVAKGTTLATLRDAFLKARKRGKEKSTQYTTGIHFKHLVDTLGERFPIGDLAQPDLQRHIERRADRGVSATTIRKEVTTLRTAWHWGIDAGLVQGTYPNKQLIYPKEDELPPYQTRDEIERRIAAGGLTEDQVDALWDALYLRPFEVAELLEHVQTNARYDWIYPLACMAAHTGGRRSELIRMLVSDVDFASGASGMITIRELKRVKAKRSTRRSPLTPLLAHALKAWRAVHPGGPWLFCQSGEIAHSKKRSRTTGHQNGRGRATTVEGRMASVTTRETQPGPSQLTVGEVHDHFKRTLAGSKWDVVRGLHTLRHSVASCLAAAGVDQRTIDDMLGHVSEEMRRRYRHLTPAVKDQAILAVFG
jgi:integrase